MKKLLSFTLTAFGLLLMSHQVQAAAYARAPKEVFVSSYTTGAIPITPVISTNSASQQMPGAVYEVTLSSGASGEYVILEDTGSCAGIVVAGQPLTTQLGPRLFFGSTTAITQIVFDPPLRFDNGLCMMDSAVTGQAAITYELGRGLSGN